MADSIFFLISLLLLLFLPTINSSLLWNYCPSDTNYTTNSSFRSNLDFLLASLSSPSTAAVGFLNSTVGSQPPSRVNGLALCRGDVSSTSCQACLASAAVEIINQCPNGTRSAICYDDCLLRYSNESFFSVVDTSFQYWGWNPNNSATDPQKFENLLGNLMDTLTLEARDSAGLFAAGTAYVSAFSRMFGLVQCTRDLSPDDCYLCLRQMVAGIPRCCDSKQGGKVYSQTCFLRFESYPFYNLSAVGAPPPSSNSSRPNEAIGAPLRQICGSTEANNAANSEYHTNLNLLLSSLSSSTAAATGFHNYTIGRPPNQVYGLALCRGDLSFSDCQGCLNASVTQITDGCPTSMKSTVWYDLCMLRYSNENFFSTVDIIRYGVYLKTPYTEPQSLSFLLGKLMDSLATKAARSSLKMFAVDNVSLTSSTNIYGLEQCTRDLSGDDCYHCLLDSVLTIPTVCNSSQGCWMFGQSCSIRYETYPFYNISATEGVSPPLSPPPTGNEGESNSNWRRIRLIVISIAAALIVLCAIFVYRQRTKATQRRRQLAATFNHKDQLEIRIAESLLFDLEAIRKATDNFSDRNKLGEGGFGSVYKGTLENGEHVAVKRLSRSSGQGLDELKNEVFLVAKLRHRNLVRLLGCCLESEEKLLVYNYLANTSLDKFLFDNSKREQLDWVRRFKIIEGISRGLLYLHEDSPLKIIHRDLKASNILLDANMNPKISDFGLAKLFGVDETQGNTNRIAGTFGYMAPEYALHGLFSIKSDVYSYGVLVLEILTGHKNSGYRGSEYPIELVTHVVWRYWTQGSALQVIDQDLVEQCQAQQILRCIHIGLLCVQEDPIQRPTMANVVLMLNSHFVDLPTPLTPAFLSNRNTTSGSNGIPKRGNSGGSEGILMKISENNVSISALEPR